MKKVLVVSLVAVAALLFAPKHVSAAPPPPCPGQADQLFLSPSGATVDGVAVFRSADTGRFTSPDGGLVFDVEASDVVPLEGPAVSGCVQPSTSMSLTLIDPFTGLMHTLALNQVTP